MALGLSTAIKALNLSDTFTTLKDRINSIITKVNTIDANSTTINTTSLIRPPVVLMYVFASIGKLITLSNPEIQKTSGKYPAPQKLR